MYTKLSPNMVQLFKRCRRILGRYLSTYGEYAKETLPYSHNTPRGTKLSLYTYDQMCQKPPQATVPLMSRVADFM
jgi:hypothetical protein